MIEDDLSNVAVTQDIIQEIIHLKNNMLITDNEKNLLVIFLAGFLHEGQDRRHPMILYSLYCTT